MLSTIFKRELRSICTELSQVTAGLSQVNPEPGASRSASLTRLWGTALPAEKAQARSTARYPRVTPCVLPTRGQTIAQAFRLQRVFPESTYFCADVMTGVNLHMCIIKLFLNPFFFSESSKGKRSFISTDV